VALLCKRYDELQGLPIAEIRDEPIELLRYQTGIG
jgi:hypothetical protein